jgi:hypothetical protein
MEIDKSTRREETANAMWEHENSIIWYYLQFKVLPDI